MGIDGIEIKYGYTGSFEETPEVQIMATSWYDSGTEVIFTAAGLAGYSVIAAAEAAGAKVIGVDTDQSPYSETVITSAKKEVALSIIAALDDYYSGNFKGGISETLDITTNSIGLPMDNSRFNTFNSDDYLIIYNKLLSDEDGIRTNIPNYKTNMSASELSTRRVKVVKME